MSEAQEQYESSLALSKRIIQEYGESAARLRDLGVAQSLVGDIYLQQDKVAEAQEQYEFSLTIKKRIISEYGECETRLRDLIVMLQRLVLKMSHRQQFATALLYARNGRETAQILYDQYSKPHGKLMIAWFDEQTAALISKTCRHSKCYVVAIAIKRYVIKKLMYLLHIVFTG